MKIAWSDAYSVEFELFDKQHQRLFHIFDQLLEVTHAEATHEQVNDLLKELASYTRTHFTSEEEFMLIYGYPQYDAHKRAHDTFRKQLQELESEHDKDRIQLMNSVVVYLQKWLIEHIGVVDQKLGEFLGQKGLKF